MIAVGSLLKRIADRSIPEPNTGCWLWTGSFNHAGYGITTIGHRRHSASRAAYIGAYGEIPGGLHVLHQCDTPACCNPAHLFLGTHAENMADRGRKGRCAIGSKNGSNRLSSEDVRRIRERSASGAAIRSLAREFSVSKTTIKQIVRREIWRHQEEPHAAIFGAAWRDLEADQ